MVIVVLLFSFLCEQNIVLIYSTHTKNIKVLILLFFVTLRLWVHCLALYIITSAACLLLYFVRTTSSISCILNFLGLVLISSCYLFSSLFLLLGICFNVGV